MASIHKSVEVKVPIKTAYNQWTQFEQFPAFMEGVESVEQLDDKRLAWKAKIGGKTIEWTAEITEQLPDQRIAWRSTSGARNDGVVRFEKRQNDLTLVDLAIEYQPEGGAEKTGDALGVVGRRVAGDLNRFKSFIEKRGAETGAWRGEIGPESEQSQSAAR